MQKSVLSYLNIFILILHFGNAFVSLGLCSVLLTCLKFMLKTLNLSCISCESFTAILEVFLLNFTNNMFDNA